MATPMTDAAVEAGSGAAVETVVSSAMQPSDSSSAALPASTSPALPTAEPSTSSPPAPLSSGDLSVARILDLKKALDDGLAQTSVDHAHLLSVLQELSGLNGLINAQLLSQTQVGHAVNRLTRIPASSPVAQALAVRDAAKAIIAQWKDKVKPKTANTTAAAPAAAVASPSAQTTPAAVSLSPILHQPADTVALSSASSSIFSSSPSSLLPTQPSFSPPVSPFPLLSATRSVTSPSPTVTQAAGSAGSAVKRKSTDSKQDARDELKKRQMEMKEAQQSSSSRTQFNVKTSFTPSSPSPPSQPSPVNSSSSYQLGKHADATRNKIQRLLFEAIGGSAVEWETELAVRMEQAMFELYKGNTSSGYRQKYRELAMNLRDPLNPDINSALLCGAWQPETVVAMSVKELASSSLKAQREAEARWAREEARSDLGKLNGLTDMFRCGKCRERKCTYYQMQTRSADEPMTVFVRCTVCGNRWKC